MEPEIHEKRITVSESHLDQQQHVNNVQYVQWIQDIAKEHWKLKAPEADQAHYFWVVVRHEVDYRKEAVLGDELLLQTYVSESSHVKSIRHVIIKNAETDKTLVQAQTTWCLMDAETKRPSKIPEELKRIFQQ